MPFLLQLLYLLVPEKLVSLISWSCRQTPKLKYSLTRLVYVLYKKEQHVCRAYFYPFKGRCSEDWRRACSVAFKVKACLVSGVENLHMSQWIHSKMWFAYCYLISLRIMMYEQSVTINECFNIPLLKRERLPVRSLNHVHASMISYTIYTTGIRKPEISST